MVDESCCERRNTWIAFLVAVITGVLVSTVLILKKASRQAHEEIVPNCSGLKSCHDHKGDLLHCEGKHILSFRADDFRADNHTQSPARSIAVFFTMARMDFAWLDCAGRI